MKPALTVIAALLCLAPPALCAGIPAHRRKKIDAALPLKPAAAPPQGNAPE